MLDKLKTSLKTLHSMKVAEIRNTLKEEKRRERKTFSKKRSDDPSKQEKPLIKPSSRLQSAGNKSKRKQVRFNEDLEL